MMSKIALCADSQCLNDPATLGLKGERILDQTWIVPFADALIARKYLREHDVAETWVVSNDTDRRDQSRCRPQEGQCQTSGASIPLFTLRFEDEPLSKRWSYPHLRKPRIRPSLYCPQIGPCPSSKEARISRAPLP